MKSKRRPPGVGVIGETISDYRILAELENSHAYATYVAEDVRDENRQRQVVLKVLPASLIGTEAARQRLTQVVRGITTLNHPNICRVLRIETLDLRTVLIRDFADGESLGARLKRGAIEFDEALAIFIQLVRAVDAAHKRGVVHRNLKASNVFIDSGIGGKPLVKIADFGFLHLLEPLAGSLAATCHSTLTYRSPEEVLRTVVDPRSDIWSLGVLLYEILTGTPPFQSSNAAVELLAILKDEYEPLKTSNPRCPRSLDWILSRCLAKNPNQRFETAGELASEIAVLAEGKPVVEEPSKAGPAETEPPAETEVQRAPQFAFQEERQFPWLATALVVVAIGLLSAWLLLPRDPEIPRLRKYALAPAEFGTPEGRAVISPDGRSVAYVAGNEQTKLWIQDLSQDRPREIAGTEGATRPFWSPDGQWIGFLANSVIMKASVANSSIVNICPIGPQNDSFSASWSPDGTAVMFTAGSPSELFRVPAEGGQPKSFLQSLQGGGAPTFVHCLPSSFRLGRVLLVSSDGEDAVYAYDLRRGEHKRLGLPAVSAIYSPTGHLLFQRSDAAATPLFAVPFSLDSMETTGDAFSIEESASWPSVSTEGTLVYRRDGGPWLKQLIWLDRKGMNVGTVGKQWSSIRQVILSKDGRVLGALATDRPGSTAGFWTYEHTSAEWRTGPIDGEVRSIALSTSGDRALLSADAAGAGQIYVRQIGASHNDRVDQSLRTNASSCDITDWSTYGRHIVCNRTSDDGTSDLWRLTYDLDAGRFRESPVIKSAFDERDGAISPDSRWLAFLSNQTGRHEVHVARFPSGDNAVQISTEGASQPRWGRDLNELYYVSGNDLVSVSLQTEPHLAVSAKTVLFSSPGLASDPSSGERHYDVDPGRGRFLVASTVLASGGVPATIRIVENWIEEFRRHEE